MFVRLVKLLTLASICEAHVQYAYVTAVPSHPPSIEISATQSMLPLQAQQLRQGQKVQKANIILSYEYGNEEHLGIFLGIGTLLLVRLVLQILENKKNTILPVCVKVNDMSSIGPMESVSGESIVYVRRYSPILK